MNYSRYSTLKSLTLICGWLGVITSVLCIGLIVFIFTKFDEFMDRVHNFDYEEITTKLFKIVNIHVKVNRRLIQFILYTIFASAVFRLIISINMIVEATWVRTSSSSYIYTYYFIY